jgi:hypothetical protein
VIGQCPRCGVDIDMDRQSTIHGERLLVDSVTDPFAGGEWMIAYCWPCAVTLWPDLEQIRWP